MDRMPRGMGTLRALAAPVGLEALEIAVPPAVRGEAIPPAPEGDPAPATRGVKREASEAPTPPAGAEEGTKEDRAAEGLLAAGTPAALPPLAAPLPLITAAVPGKAPTNAPLDTGLGFCC
jgi:hypothetical protein